MTSIEQTSPQLKLSALRARLVAWLVDSAYPLWASNGIDPANGGFIETLGQNGVGLPHPRRARVHPRQIFAFAQAAEFGWKGDVAGIVGRGMEYFIRFYQKEDGFFRTLAGVDGTPLDDRALLYDQAFALLGFAAAGSALDARIHYEAKACALRHLIEARLKNADGSFRSSEAQEGVIESNPHMHLLEACLAWAEVGNDPGWKDWARDLSGLALTRFIRKESGMLGEAFAADGAPVPEPAGRLIEPGHQFEWAWLLMRTEIFHPGTARSAALKLMTIGEQYGVHNQVAVNSLLDDLTLHDPNARFWPQTERVKAALLAAQRTGEVQYLDMAAAAALSMFPYLESPVTGLWFDVQLPNGEMIDSPAPASTLYHLVGAIAALHRAGEPPGKR